MPPKPEEKPQCVTLEDGTREWRRAGVLHRLDGPAIEWLDGANEWFRHGKRHREDGPAVRHPDGYKEWWLDGRELTEAEFQRIYDEKRRLREKAGAEAKRQQEENARQEKSAATLRQRLQAGKNGRFRLGR